MKKLLISLILIILISMLIGCAKEITTALSIPRISTSNISPTAPIGVPPGTAGAANDDIVFPPGGFTYRATVHQVDQPDWPSIEQTEATLWNLTRIANITYRSYIETKAGETRNNILYLKIIGFPSLDPLKAAYESVNLPEGFTLERGEEMNGGIGGQDEKSSRIVMKINISEKVAPGEYTFQFKVMVDGAKFGSVPCTVKVLD
jgi:hypothetical protein